MNGIVNEKKLLDAMQVPNKLETGAVDWSKITSEVGNGNPVIVSTPGHYFTVDGARQQPDGSTLYHMGTSGTDLKAGAEWMSAADMQRVMGTANGALFADHPQAQGPSLTESIGTTARNVSNAVQVKAQDLLNAVTSTGSNAVDALRQGAQNATSTLGTGLPDITSALNTSQIPGGAQSPLGRAVQGQQLTPAEQLVAGGQTLLGYEQARNEATAALNPARDVPVVGGLINSVTDPLALPGNLGIANAAARGGSAIAGAVGRSTPELVNAAPTVLSAAQPAQVSARLATALGGAAAGGGASYLATDENDPNRWLKVGAGAAGGALVGASIGNLLEHGIPEPPAVLKPPPPPPGSPQRMQWLLDQEKWAPTPPPLETRLLARSSIRITRAT
jgi:hypothetical protein